MAAGQSASACRNRKYCAMLLSIYRVIEAVLAHLLFFMSVELMQRFTVRQFYAEAPSVRQTAPICEDRQFRQMHAPAFPASHFSGRRLSSLHT